MIKTALVLILLAISIPSVAQTVVTQETIEDYIDMAYLYQNVHNYAKALEYINVIEVYDDYNPKIKYQKVFLLKSINAMLLAKYTLDKLILLNTDYACSQIALEFYKEQASPICYSAID